jgi:hypothetical protein
MEYICRVRHISTMMGPQRRATFQPGARIPHAAGDWRTLPCLAALRGPWGSVTNHCAVFLPSARKTRIVPSKPQPARTHHSAAIESQRHQTPVARAVAHAPRLAACDGHCPRLSESHELKREVGHRRRPLRWAHGLKCLSGSRGVSSTVARSPDLVGIEVAAAALEGRTARGTRPMTADVVGAVITVQ